MDNNNTHSKKVKLRANEKLKCIPEYQQKQDILDAKTVLEIAKAQNRPVKRLTAKDSLIAKAIQKDKELITRTKKRVQEYALEYYRNKTAPEKKSKTPLF